MGESSGSNERGGPAGSGPTAREAREQIEGLIAAKDAKFLNPSDRAAAIYDLLNKEHPDLTTWDLTCFASYWLYVMAAQFPWLTPSVKEACKLVTFSHYHMDEAGLVSVLTRAGGIEQFKTTATTSTGEAPKDESSNEPK